MRHWHGVVLALLLALICLVIELMPDTLVSKDRALFGLFSVLVATLVETVWLIGMDLVETKQARREMSAANEKTQEVLVGIQTGYEELVRSVSVRMERDESLVEVVGNQRPGLSPEEVRERWMYLLSRLRNTYSATNYIRDIYGKDWAQAALHIQFAKKAEGDVGIRKVFLFDGEDELVHAAQFIEEQRGIGVHVYYLLYSALEACALGKRIHAQDIPLVDFGIFDKEKVLGWELNDKREVVGGRLMFGSDQVARHQTFFDDLFRKARDFTNGRFTVVPVRPAAVKDYAGLVDRWRSEDGAGYTGQYANIDYALRLTGGWLTQFRSKPGTVVLAAFLRGEHVAFSLLVGESPQEKEFYVAVHPRYLKKHVGRKLTRETVAYGFKKMGLSRIHLKVRPEPAYRVALYLDMGFQKFGTEVTEEINGIQTEFIQMEMRQDRFREMDEESV